MDRRFFLQAAAVGTASIPFSGQTWAANEPGKIQIQDGHTVLFQGDSITDSGRSREDDSKLGGGYAMMTSAWISAQHPERKIQFLNRGISGNRVVDLEARWKEDCLDLEPDWVSILIGVNDTWRRYDRNDPTTAEAYEEGYRDLLKQIQGHLNANVILCEPFLLHVSEKVSQMRQDLDPKIEGVRKLAAEFDAGFLPLDTIFKEAVEHRPPDFWAKDGVHPTPAGHALISQAWIEAVSE
jgi:lysophospholipase L1-like esterase